MYTVMPCLQVTVMLVSFGLLIKSVETTSSVDRQLGSCPTWYVFNNITEKCSCRGLKEWVICDQDAQRVLLAGGLCMTFDNDSGETDVGRCPYTTFNRQNDELLQSGYLVLPDNVTDLNEFMCGPLNREGYLCSKCKEGYGLTIANAFQKCVKCSYPKGVGWLFYFMLQLIPLTVLFLVVSVLRISLARPPMRAFVVFYQSAVAVIFTHMHQFHPPYVRNSPALRTIHYLYIVLFGIWGMSLTENVPGITDFCVDPNINPQHAFTLKQIQSAFPLLLVLVTYACIQLHSRDCRLIIWLWKPFHKCFSSCIQKWNPKLSLVDVFSTFLLLSFSRYNIQLYFLLSGQHTYSANAGEWNRASVLLYNPAVSFFHPLYHLPYIFILLFIFLIVALPPVLLLAFYQTSSCQKILTCIGLHKMPSTHIFVDLFQGCYKDGTSGNYDLRFTASLYLAAIMVTMFSYVGCSYSTYANCALVSVFTWTFLLLLFFALVKPYKDQCMNVLDSLLLAGTTVVSVLLAVTSHSIEHKAFNLLALIIVLVIIAIPHVVLCSYLLYKLLNCVQKRECFQQFATWMPDTFKEKQKVEPIELTESLPHRIDNPYRNEDSYKTLN